MEAERLEDRQDADAWPVSLVSGCGLVISRAEREE